MVKTQRRHQHQQDISNFNPSNFNNMILLLPYLPNEPTKKLTKLKYAWHVCARMRNETYSYLRVYFLYQLTPQFRLAFTN